MQAELALRPLQQPPDIGPVLPHDQPADDKGQRNDPRTGEAVPGNKREAAPGPQGPQGHIPRQNRQQQEPAPDHQGDPPVDHNGDGPAGEDALAPLEPEHTGVEDILYKGFVKASYDALLFAI